MVLLLEALDDVSNQLLSSALAGKAVNSEPLSYMATFKFSFVCNVDWVIYICDIDSNLDILLTEHKRSARNCDINNHIAEHLSFKTNRRV